jgi:hypothetical protein
LKPNDDRDALEIQMNWENLIISSTINLGFGHSLEVYPNPAEDILYVKGIRESKAGQVFFYDPAGRLLMSAQLSPAINVSELMSGFYYMRVHTAEGFSNAVPLYKR